MRFWMSWWAGDNDDMRPIVDDENVPPWGCSGERAEEPRHSICAVVDADNESTAWERIRGYWPEAQERFCREKPGDWLPEKTRFKCIIDKMKS